MLILITLQYRFEARSPSVFSKGHRINGCKSFYAYVIFCAGSGENSTSNLAIIFMGGSVHQMEPILFENYQKPSFGGV
jgi:hypothetical protein